MGNIVASDMNTDRLTINNEHDMQIRLLEAIVKGADDQRPGNELMELVDQLVEYTNVHFLSEQLLMRLYAYPAYAEHEDHHYRLLDQIKELQRALADGEEEQLQQLARSLQDWVTGHIMRDDSQFSRYLEKGSSSAIGC